MACYGCSMFLLLLAHPIRLNDRSCNGFLYLCFLWCRLALLLVIKWSPKQAIKLVILLKLRSSLYWSIYLYSCKHAAVMAFCAGLLHRLFCGYFIRQDAWLALMQLWWSVDRSKIEQSLWEINCRACNEENLFHCLSLQIIIRSYECNRSWARCR